MTKGRRPRKDEFELWLRVAKSATPLHPKRQSEVVIPAATAPTDDQETVIRGLPKKLNPSRNNPPHNFAPPLQEAIQNAPLRMDKKAFNHLNRGRLDPEAKLDLHGMTLERAHPALTSFVLKQFASGKRLVLVITGKGKSRDDGGPVPVRHGVLKHQVPQWLAIPPLSNVVLQVVQAHQKHGGGGAYYVYLKRRK